jgi:hypothetical protein
VDGAGLAELPGAVGQRADAAALLEANLTRLDLSFNRLAGTLAASTTPFYATQNTSQVSLQVNRRSLRRPAHR